MNYQEEKEKLCNQAEAKYQVLYLKRIRCMEKEVQKFKEAEEICRENLQKELRKIMPEVIAKTESANTTGSKVLLKDGSTATVQEINHFLELLKKVEEGNIVDFNMVDPSLILEYSDWVDAYFIWLSAFELNENLKAYVDAVKAKYGQLIAY